MHTISGILDLIRLNGLSMADFFFGEAGGLRRCTTIPTAGVNEETLSRGLRIDGVLLRPDLATARIDGLRSVPTLSMICDVYEGDGNAPEVGDPRGIALRAEAHLRATGIADVAQFAGAPAFFLLGATEAHYEELRHAVRSEIALELAKAGTDVESHSALASGANAVAIRNNSLLRAADSVATLQQVAAQIAARRGHAVHFSGAFHCHQSLWREGRTVFFDTSGYAECSQTMLYYIGGILAHVSSLLAFAGPPAEACVAFSTRNRAAAAGIARANGDARAQRVTFRAGDASANPYLAFSAMLLAGLDGIAKRIDPVRAGFGPLDRDLRDLPPGEAAKLKAIPTSTNEALAALALDHDYLTADGVFTASFVRDWIAAKTEAANEPCHPERNAHEAHLQSRNGSNEG